MLKQRKFQPTMSELSKYLPPLLRHTNSVTFIKSEALRLRPARKCGNPFYGCEMTITSLSPKFKVIDNALYGDEGMTLIHVSRFRERFCVAEGTELIDKTSLDLITEELVIPASVKEIRFEYDRQCTARHVIFKGKVEKMPQIPIYELFLDLKRVTIPRGTKSHYDKVFNFAIDESD